MSCTRFTSTYNSVAVQRSTNCRWTIRLNQRFTYLLSSRNVHYIDFVFINSFIYLFLSLSIFICSSSGSNNQWSFVHFVSEVVWMCYSASFVWKCKLVTLTYVSKWTLYTTTTTTTTAAAVIAEGYYPAAANRRSRRDIVSSGDVRTSVCVCVQCCSGTALSKHCCLDSKVLW